MQEAQTRARGRQNLDTQNNGGPRYIERRRRSSLGRSGGKLLTQIGKMSINHRMSKSSSKKSGILPERERQKISRVLKAKATEPAQSSEVLRKRLTGKVIHLSDDFKNSMQKNNTACRFYKALKLIQECPSRRR